MALPAHSILPGTCEALTGSPLKEGEQVEVCRVCAAAYSPESRRYLVANAAACVGCGRNRTDFIVSLVAFDTPVPLDPIAAAHAKLSVWLAAGRHHVTVWARALVMGLSRDDPDVIRLRPVAVPMTARGSVPCPPFADASLDEPHPPTPAPNHRTLPEFPSDADAAMARLGAARQVGTPEELALAWMAVRALVGRRLNRTETMEYRAALSSWGRQLAAAERGGVGTERM